MPYESLNYEVENGVAHIVLNRAHAHNAVNIQMARELPLMWRRFSEDKNAIVAILTGAGDRAFCAGADLADLPDTTIGRDFKTVDSMRWTSLRNDVWKPVICAVNGLTVGGGLHFVADSDIVLASTKATFFDTHVKVGLAAGLEPVCLARKIPLEAVLRMMLVGGNERMSAQRALEIGLIGEVVQPEDLLERAREIAEMVKTNSPEAMAKTKKAIWRGLDMGLDDAMQYAWELIIEQEAHPDFKEGTSAFLQKRLPRWQPLGDS